MTVSLYTSGLDAVGNGSWVADTYGTLLVQSTYSFNPDHVHVSDIVASEVTESGYSRQTLTSKTRTVDLSGGSPPNIILLGAASPITFGNPITTGQTTNAMVLYKNAGSDATRLLVAYFPFTALDTAAIAPFTCIIGATGLLSIAA